MNLGEAQRALHGATAHISMAKSSLNQRKENAIYPIIKSPKERKRESTGK